MSGAEDPAWIETITAMQRAEKLLPQEPPWFVAAAQNLADVVVKLTDRIDDEDRARSISAARVPIPAGVPGICEGCADDMPRLVDGRCGYCRDGRTMRGWR